MVRVPDITLCKCVVIIFHEIHNIYVVFFGGLKHNILNNFQGKVYFGKCSFAGQTLLYGAISVSWVKIPCMAQVHFDSWQK